MTKVIAAGNLTINTLVTDTDVLSDFDEKEPLRVAALAAVEHDYDDGRGPVPVLKVTLVGVRIHVDYWGPYFRIEVQEEE